MEQENERLQEQVDALRKPNGKSLPNDRSRSGKSPATNSSLHPEFDFDLEEPEIDMGSPRKSTGSKSTKPTPATRPTPSAVPESEGTGSEPGSEPELIPPPEKASRQSAADEEMASVNPDRLADVEEIYINSILTKVSNLDDIPGNDGLLLVLEPRDDKGRYVPSAGAIAVELRDPRRTGERARIAAWEMDSHQTGQYLRRPKQGRGIYLPLRFSSPITKFGRLQLVVRYTTSDDRELEATHDLVIDRATAARDPWFPRSEQRPAGVAEDRGEDVSQSLPEYDTPRELPTLEPPALIGSRRDSGPPERPAWKPVR